MNNSVLSDNTKLGRVCFDNLELYRSHSSANKEGISFADRSVGCIVMMTLGNESKLDQIDAYPQGNMA